MQLPGIFMLAAGMSTPLLAAGADEARLAIIRPSHQETIHNNLGTVNVVVSLQGLDLSAGRYLRILLDGTPHGAQRHTLSFSIEQVNRGEHTLQVVLVDAANAVVSASPTTTFYLWQASSLFPSRQSVPHPK